MAQESVGMAKRPLPQTEGIDALLAWLEVATKARGAIEQHNAHSDPDDPPPLTPPQVHEWLLKLGFVQAHVFQDCAVAPTQSLS